jgi:hypothetical protein
LFFRVSFENDWKSQDQVMIFLFWNIWQPPGQVMDQRVILRFSNI